MAEIERQSGAASTLSLQKFFEDIEVRLIAAREAASRNQRLEWEFSHVERPLVFFIDYIVKEGPFPFKDEWRELGRNYNELSGDEKFFDIFAELINDPECANPVMLFYLMLGLGFDGIYRSDPMYIKNCMKQINDRYPIDFDIHSDPIVDENIEKRNKIQRWRRILSKFLTVKTAIVFSLLFMAICLLINLSSFQNATRVYRQVLTSTAISTTPAVEIPKDYLNEDK
jgi:type VI protein secretion system component VasF